MLAPAEPEAPAAVGVSAATAAPTHAVTAAAVARHASGGFLLLAVPAADDLVELRAAVLGEGRLRDRLQPALARLAAHFELVRHVTVRTRLHLDAAAAHDLLAATYRGVRHRERRRADGLLEPAAPSGPAATPAMEVTASRDLATLRSLPR